MCRDRLCRVFKWTVAARSAPPTGNLSEVVGNRKVTRVARGKRNSGGARSAAGLTVPPYRRWNANWNSVGPGSLGGPRVVYGGRRRAWQSRPTDLRRWGETAHKCKVIFLK